jgi:tetratricopeptide (TPR) repeat protein
MADLDRTPADHPEHARRLEDLGAGYRDRYLATGAMEDLDTAIQLYQDAINRTPVDHPEQARQLQSLGIGYLDRYRATGAMPDFDTAIQRLQEALDHSASPVNARLSPGRTLVALHADVKNWVGAFHTASKAVSLVPLLTLRSLEASDKQRLLMSISGLASDAAAIALNAAKTPSDAIQLLELGREIIAGSLNEIRADVSELHQKHPQLAEEYMNLRDQLDTPKTSTQRQVNQRYNAGQKLEETIRTIQALPEFDRFLLAPLEDGIKSAAEYGPIVVINISKYRCDALIIENSQLRSLRLSRLHISDIRDFMIENLAAPKILEWLWETVAQPVLDTLGFSQPPADDCWPHIWWIPTGPLSKFPIHAAGRHTNGSAQTVLDRVMSSYSSSIKAIIHGRRQRRNLEGMVSNPAKALLVAIEYTPGYFSRLPFATREVEMLRDLCGSMALESIEPGRRKQDIISHLPQC